MPPPTRFLAKSAPPKARKRDKADFATKVCKSSINCVNVILEHNKAYKFVFHVYFLTPLITWSIFVNLLRKGGTFYNPQKARNRNICLICDKSVYATSQMYLLRQLCTSTHGCRGCKIIGPGGGGSLGHTLRFGFC